MHLSFADELSFASRRSQFVQFFSISVSQHRARVRSCDSPESLCKRRDKISRSQTLVRNAGSRYSRQQGVATCGTLLRDRGAAHFTTGVVCKRSPLHAVSQGARRCTLCTAPPRYVAVAAVTAAIACCSPLSVPKSDANEAHAMWTTLLRLGPTTLSLQCRGPRCSASDVYWGVAALQWRRSRLRSASPSSLCSMCKRGVGTRRCGLTATNSGCGECGCAVDANAQRLR